MNPNLNLISRIRIGVRTAPSTIRTCLREAATPLHLLGLYRPLTNKRPSPRSLMYLASQKYSLHSRHLTLILNGNPMWYTEPKLATLQELVRLQDPQTCRTTRDPHRPCLTSQRGMPSRYGLKLRWDLDTSYLLRTTPALRISPSRF